MGVYLPKSNFTLLDYSIRFRIQYYLIIVQTTRKNLNNSIKFINPMSPRPLS